MASGPPPLPSDEGRLRLASTANALLPGAGLFLIGRRTLGLVLAGLFLGCFGAVLVLFLVGYSQYLSTALSDDLMKEGRLEQMNEGFHRGWLLTVAGLGVVIHLISFVLFSREKKRKQLRGG